MNFQAYGVVQNPLDLSLPVSHFQSLSWRFSTLSPSIGHRTFQFDLGKGGLGAEGGRAMVRVRKKKHVFSSFFEFFVLRGEDLKVFFPLIFEMLEKCREVCDLFLLLFV